MCPLKEATPTRPSRALWDLPWSIFDAPSGTIFLLSSPIIGKNPLILTWKTKVPILPSIS